MIAALKEGVEKYGLNVAASRLTTGNHVLYQQLEERLAAFFGSESALLVSAGYVTNLIVAQTLAGSFSHAIVDEKAHPSLWDAARPMDCPVMKLPALGRRGSGAGRATLRTGREVDAADRRAVRA